MEPGAVEQEEFNPPLIFLKNVIVGKMEPILDFSSAVFGQYFAVIGIFECIVGVSVLQKKSYLLDAPTFLRFMVGGFAPVLPSITILCQPTLWDVKILLFIAVFAISILDLFFLRASRSLRNSWLVYNVKLPDLLVTFGRLLKTKPEIQTRQRESTLVFNQSEIKIVSHQKKQVLVASIQWLKVRKEEAKDVMRTFMQEIRGIEVGDFPWGGVAHVILGIYDLFLSVLLFLMLVTGIPDSTLFGLIFSISLVIYCPFLAALLCSFHPYSVFRRIKK